MLAIAFKDMKIRGMLTILLQKQAIKGVIDFKKGEALEILGYAFNREGFFIEALVPDYMAPAGNPLLIPSLRINLLDSPSIPVTGRSNQYGLILSHFYLLLGWGIRAGYGEHIGRGVRFK